MCMSMLRVAILVVSDTAAQSPAEDRSIAGLHAVFDGQQEPWEVMTPRIVPDTPAQIQEAIQAWTDGDDATATPNLVLTTGGTGFSPRDQTPEAVAELIEKQAYGLVHAMMASSLSVTPFGMMSRPVAGVRRQTILVTLPGSPKGAVENLQAIIKQLPHACRLVRGENSRALHRKGVDSTNTPGHGTNRGPSHCLDHGHSHSPSHGHSHAPVAHASPANKSLSNDVDLGPSQRNRSSPYPMVSVPDALAVIQQHSQRTRVVEREVGLPLIGHIVADDVYVPDDVPAFEASIVDGYAVSRVGSFSGVYTVQSVSHAEAFDQKAFALGRQEVVRVTTGAPVPTGTAAVIMVESTRVHKTDARGVEEVEVEIQAEGVQEGDNIRRVGSDLAKDSLLLKKGTRITSLGGELAMLISAGVHRVFVYDKPTVGVMSTGHELVDVGQSDGPLRPGQVYDTNRTLLLAALAQAGFEAVDLGIVRDEVATLEESLRGAFWRVDVVVTTGGVSMGETDLLKPVLERRLGGQIHFGRVNVKPGKPTTFATVPVKDSAGKWGREAVSVFALPGNPVSAAVTFQVLVLPHLHQLSGVQSTATTTTTTTTTEKTITTTSAGLPEVTVVLGHAFPVDRRRPEYHRARLHVQPDGRLVATSTGGQRSSRVASLEGAHALVYLAASAEGKPAAKGSCVPALLVDHGFTRQA